MEVVDGQPEPPLYLARMKRQNRDGVQRLAALPPPRAPDDLADLENAGLADVIVSDVRADRRKRSSRGMGAGRELSPEPPSRSGPDHASPKFFYGLPLALLVYDSGAASLLDRTRLGDADAFDQLVGQLYGELRHIARAQRQRLGTSDTIDTTAVVTKPTPSSVAGGAGRAAAADPVLSGGERP